MDGALHGLTVVDVSDGVSGAYCTKLLADYGADVLSVEPLAGRAVRRAGPFADEANAAETGAMHLYLDTNKRSVSIDLATPSGRILLAALLDHAHALVDDHPPGFLDGLGLDTATRTERWPALVTTHVTTFGTDGPYASFPSVNLTAFATGGQMSLTGEPDREPLRSGGEQADYQAGLAAFTATLAGLWASGDTGEGDDIDVSGMEAMASVLETSLPNYCFLRPPRGAGGGRRGNILSSSIGLYPCADGYLGIHAMPRNWPPLLKFLEAEWVTTDERFSTAQARLQHDDELRAVIYDWTMSHGRKEAYARAGTMRAPVAYVHDMADLLDSPHLAEREWFRTVDHPVAGALTYPGAPFRMSGTPARAGRAPLLGEHTAEVLTGVLGLTDADVGVLRARGVVR